MNAIQSLIDALNNENLIGRLVITQDHDVESILCERDEEGFSSRWMQAFRGVESQKPVFPIGPTSGRMINDLRELAFLKAFERWESSDLAAYISDDFGLIGEALAMNVSDPWIADLMFSYSSGRIPSSVDAR